MHPALTLLYLLAAWALWWYLKAAGELPFDAVVVECFGWYCLKCFLRLFAAANGEPTFFFLP